MENNDEERFDLCTEERCDLDIQSIIELAWLTDSWSARARLRQRWIDRSPS